MENFKHKKIVLFFWDGWISVSPSITNTLLLLHKSGYEVDCITRYVNDELAEEVDFPEGINIYRFGKKNNLSPLLASATNKVRKNNKIKLKSQIKNILGINNLKYNFNRNFEILKSFLGYIIFAKRIIKQNKYSNIIGVDTYGLVASGILFFFKRKEIVYFSLEIRFVSDFKYFVERTIKRIEKYFHRKSKFTIIQDKYRYEALCNENKISISKKKYFIVPNGLIGVYRERESNHFREMFSFSKSDVVILHAGGISSGYLNDEIAVASANWSEKNKLVFHFSIYKEENSREIQNLKKLSNNKAFFSTKPVALNQLAEITASANIGLAFYNKDRGLNHSLILGASGKMASYLSVGIPVIVLDLIGFRALFEKYECGIVIKNLSECEVAINTIMANYEKYHLGAIKCFNEVYEFETHFKKVTEQLNTK